MRTKIISAFPGTGKSHFTTTSHGRALDSDSSKFSWRMNVTTGETERDPQFPKLYVDHILANVGSYEYIFVSTHKEVRDALLERCVFFYLFHPHRREKEAYLQRYRDRGNPNSFVNLVEKSWDKWIDELIGCDVGCKRIEMVYPFIAQELRNIEALEGSR